MDREAMAPSMGRGGDRGVSQIVGQDSATELNIILQITLPSTAFRVCSILSDSV